VRERTSSSSAAAAAVLRAQTYYRPWTNKRRALVRGKRLTSH